MMHRHVENYDDKKAKTFASTETKSINHSAN